MVRHARDPELPRHSRDLADADAELPDLSELRYRNVIAGQERSADSDGLPRKTLQTRVSYTDWSLVRAAAAARSVGIGVLVREWIEPHLQELRDPA